MSKPPILIFGVPRSGTTLLRTLLNAHPNIACGPEAPWLADHQQQTVMGLYRSLTEGDFAFARNFGVPPAQVRERLRRLVDGLFADFAAGRGKTRWAHKTPDDCLYAPFFTELFPDARYLRIVRHPLDVALSTVRIPDERRGVSPWHEKNIVLAPGCAAANTLFNGALRWRHWNDRIEADLAGCACHRLEYEDLVTRPEETMRAVCAFLEEPYSPSLLDYGRADPILPAWERGSADVAANGGIVTSRVNRWRTELTSEEARLLFSLADPTADPVAPVARPRPAARLASIDEIAAPLYAAFAGGLDDFGGAFSLRPLAGPGDVWSFPWLWFHGLATLDGPRRRIVDLGSGLSPMPWLLAMRGARVTLVESDPQWVPTWERLRSTLRVEVDWHVVGDDTLPVGDASADAVTSFSAIGPMRGGKRAVAEMARELKPGAPLFIAFEVGEAAAGTGVPARSGRALTLEAFERDIWLHPAFGNHGGPRWNREDIPAFQNWRGRGVPQQDGMVGAAVLVKGG